MPVLVKYYTTKEGKKLHSSHWYGDYIGRDGKRRIVNLNVPIEGVKGSATFKASKVRAKEELKKLQAEAQSRKLDMETALNHFYESTGRKLDNIHICDLKNYIEGSESWKSSQYKYLNMFLEFAHRNNLGFVFDVQEDDAIKFLNELYNNGKNGIPYNTVSRICKVLHSLFIRAGLIGKNNPWGISKDGSENFRGTMRKVKRADGDYQYHRKPLSNDEIEKLLNASKEDKMTYDLIVCGLCTALRRADVCCLKWDSVDLETNTLKVKTHKTGVEVVLPIFPAFRDVLVRRKAKSQNGFVFPSAQKMYMKNPDGISYRIKKAFAKAFANKEEEDDSLNVKPISPEEALPKVLEAIANQTYSPAKKEKMVAIIESYCKGNGCKKIHSETGISKTTICDFLHEEEKISGLKFLRYDKRPSTSIKSSIDSTTRLRRAIGKKVSVRDFHSLRTSFITMMGREGMDLNKIAAMTGHTNTRTLEKFYLQTKAIDFTSEYAKAMPSVLMRDDSIEVDESKVIEELAKSFQEIVVRANQLSPNAKLEFWRQAKEIKVS